MGNQYSDPNKIAENQTHPEKQPPKQHQIIRQKENRPHSQIDNSTRKCQFVYIYPISLRESIVDDELAGRDTFDDSSITKSPSQHLAVEKIEATEPESLQEAINELAIKQNEGGSKIPVNWSSFIKIKKKNYLEDYIHIKEIGQGAFGTVSKIKMKYGGLFRAAKIVKREMLKGKGNQFISEITIPIKTDHPNLNKLFEVFEWKNQYVLITELCEGGDLFCKIKSQKTFPESKVAEIMKQILSGVVYLHRNNIVHRDLKPENMLYDNEGKMIKITDFGTAVELTSGKKLTKMVGSPFYIAPEVIAGEYNEKCDIWSCGVILYILLCGSPPFYGHREDEIMIKIRNDPLKFEGTIWNKRSKECKRLVYDMLNKNYKERISALEILNSDWMKNSVKFSNNEVGSQFVKNLTNFHFQNKLKAVVYTYIASQLFSSKDKEKLMRMFRQIDKDGDGVIGKEELLKIFQEYNGEKSTQLEIQNIINLVDTNGSGKIDFTQFLVAASNEEELLQKKRLENAFSYLDSDHSGYITAQQILPFLDQTSETQLQLKKIFEQVDENGDGQISKSQFVALLLKRQ